MTDKIIKIRVPGNKVMKYDSEKDEIINCDKDCEVCMQSKLKGDKFICTLKDVAKNYSPDNNHYLNILIQFDVEDKQYKAYDRALQDFLSALNEAGILNIEISENESI